MADDRIHVDQIHIPAEPHPFRVKLYSDGETVWDSGLIDDSTVWPLRLDLPKVPGARVRFEWGDGTVTDIPPQEVT